MKVCRGNHWIEDIFKWGDKLVMFVGKLDTRCIEKWDASVAYQGDETYKQTEIRIKKVENVM